MSREFLDECLHNYSAEVTKVYDGDTITVDLDLGFGLFKNKLSIRLFGIDTPEIRDSSPEVVGLANAAREKLLEMVPVGSKCIVRSMELDKYGRPVSVIYDANGRNINQEMLKCGLAKPYSGGARPSWP